MYRSIYNLNSRIVLFSDLLNQTGGTLSKTNVKIGVGAQIKVVTLITGPPKFRFMSCLCTKLHKQFRMHCKKKKNGKCSLNVFRKCEVDIKKCHHILDMSDFLVLEKESNFYNPSIH